MTSDTRSPAEIERDIEREREGLSDALNDLQQRFSVETIARQVTDQFREHGGEIGRSVSEAVKRNPVALALTGVGLAWLMLGDRSAPAPDDRGYRGRGYNDDRDDGYPDAAVYPGHAPGAPSTAPRSYQGTTPQRTSSGRSGAGDHLPSWARSGQEAGNRVSGAASSAAEAARRAGSTVARHGKDAAGAASEAGGSAAGHVRDLASDASDRASALRERLAEGTESLSEEAKARVIAARARALEARDRAMDYSRASRERAADMYEAQPLVAGALALALGAAIGAALPHSRLEDEYLGDYSDELIEEAERIFAEEKDKLSKVARAATDEAKRVAGEARQEADDAAETAGQAVADKAKEYGQRVADAARDEAKKQDLGDIHRS